MSGINEFTADEVQIKYANTTMTADGLADAVKKLNMMIDQAQGIAQAVSQTWSGEAQLAFRDTQQKLENAQAGLNDALSKISGQLHNTVTRFQDTDRRAASNFG